MRRLHLFKSKKFHNSRPIKLFITYFLILFVTLLLSCIYYFKTIHVIRTDALEQNTSLLLQTGSVLQLQLDEFEKICQQLSVTPSVSSFKYITNAYRYPHSYKILSTRNSLPDHKYTNKMLSDYFIFFHNSEIVLNNQITYTYDDFYSLYLNYTDLTFDEWKESVYNCHSNGFIRAQNVIYQGQAQDIFSYVYPLVSFGKIDGLIMITIPAENIKELFSGINLSENELIFIENSSGDLLAVFPDTQNAEEIYAEYQNLKDHAKDSPLINLKNVNMLRTKVETEDFILVGLQNRASILKEVTRIKNTVIWIYIVLFLLGCCLCYYFTFLHTKSLNHLLCELPAIENTSSPDIFDNLKYTMKRLVNDNQQMSQALHEQTPYIKNTFLSKLITGEFLSEQEALTLADYLDLDCRNKIFSILIFKFYSKEEIFDSLDLQYLNICKLSLKEILDSMQKGQFMYLDIAEDQLALLLIDNPAPQTLMRSTINELVKKIRSQMPQSISQRMFVYGGTSVSALSDIVRSYERAYSLLHLTSNQEEQEVIWFNEYHAAMPQYFFPYDVQNKLINLTISGKKESVYGLLKTLFTQNLFQNDIPNYLQEILLNDLISTLIKAVSQIVWNPESYEDFQNKLKTLYHASVLKRIHMIPDLFYYVCDYSAGQQNSDSASTIESIRLYINNNYGDSNLSLTGIAAKFNINESYLSYIFKQHCDINFSTYVENVRIEKAKALIKDTDLTINEVSQQVGYLSANSFCRAFKRVTGNNTSFFRKNITT